MISSVTKLFPRRARARGQIQASSALDTLEQQLLAFGRRYEQIAAPFLWKFTRADLDRLAKDSIYPPPKPPDHEYVGSLPSQST